MSELTPEEVYADRVRRPLIPLGKLVRQTGCSGEISTKSNASHLTKDCHCSQPQVCIERYVRSTACHGGNRMAV
eukprot:3577319-Amphidinium_carterae.1